MRGRLFHLAPWTAISLFVVLNCLARAEDPVASQPLQKGGHYRVYLLAGQSNMDGRASVKALTGPLASYAQPQKDVLIRYSAGGLHRIQRISGGFEWLHPGCSGTPAKKDARPPANTFGPELSFGRAMADALPGEKILLIKFSEGGTNLRSDWNPKQRDKLYEKFIAFVHQTQEMIGAAGATGELRGMLWLQGESDASLASEDYQTRLTELISKVRDDLKTEHLPFAIGQVFDNGKRTSVITAEKAVAQALPATIFVSSDGLETLDAGTHFDTASQIEFGKRFAREILKLDKHSTGQ
jgi:iduronate 2-sulfatase